MKKRTIMRKGFVVGILLFLILMSFLPGINVKNLRAVSNKKLDISQSNIELIPDIIISRVYGGFSDFEFKLFCDIKNLGATVPHLCTVGVEVVAEKYNFRTKTFETYDSFGGAHGDSSGILSGWTWTILLFDADTSNIPRGIFRFKCHTHITHEEIDTNNNNRTIIFFHPANVVWIPIWKSFELSIMKAYLRYIYCNMLGLW